MVLAGGYCHRFSRYCVCHEKDKQNPPEQKQQAATEQQTQLSDKNAQYFPLQSYRVGPYAAGGTGFFGGFIDYMKAVNAKGGVNGVKLVWSECETEYVVEKGVECYERLKNGLNGAPAAATNPLSVGIAYATLERSTKDKLPLITINHGRTDSTDGRVFPYVFPLQLNPYSEVSAIINYLGQQSGGVEKLKGKKKSWFYITVLLTGKKRFQLLRFYRKSMALK